MNDLMIELILIAFRFFLIIIPMVLILLLVCKPQFRKMLGLQIDKCRDCEENDEQENRKA